MKFQKMQMLFFKQRSPAVEDTVLLGVRWGNIHRKEISTEREGLIYCKDYNCYAPQYITTNDLEGSDGVNPVHGKETSTVIFCIPVS